MNRERYNQDWNNPGNIRSTEAGQIYKNTKVVVQNLLKNFLESYHNEFQKRDQELVSFQWEDSSLIANNKELGSPIYIHREWPRENRNYPLILISLSQSSKEKKLTLGWDNIAYTETVDIGHTKVGKVTQVQHKEFEIEVGIGALSVDDRDFLVSMISTSFIQFFRSNYEWRSPDDTSSLMLHFSSQEISDGIQETPETDSVGGDTNPIFLGSVVFNCLAEHYYTVTSKDFIVDYNFEVESQDPTTKGKNDPFSSNYQIPQ